MHKMPYVALTAALLLAACVVVPERGGAGYVIAPALPGVVILDVEPYYFHGGFYYHYHSDRWSYSHDRTGPWRDLPRDRYPGEVRFKHRDGGDKDRGRDRGYRD